ncbi:AEC family transporter [Pseudomonas gingeri]|uniref:AEC family transporter n=1 Tax=Pseudomonas gingeri TaxID=117681 RepID=UPI0015A3EDA7|nr:AEC family transporter [Pseudomonas gingeri]NVZ99397.1 AEC family transporter [Pseudomonas gingeri]NWA13442.1 AEC family transporter [Pseudomonas gingeri]NWA55703.1 AEC family transporter [Pseudomonas gingeri]NWA95443.1 AEC family transporter [Pseudomonas gingeri]NWB00530.1 AEC family transporter [Pseudomonas gingeri]
MSSVLSVLLPIFALILVGFICRRSNRLGPNAASEINRMVVWLCLPALLFKATATATWEQIWHPGFVLAFTLSTLAMFVLTLLLRWRKAGHFADASIDALSASYANTGYIGIPLCVMVLGQNGLEPALIASLLVVCVLFGLALVCIEVGLQTERQVHRIIFKVLLALAKNPLVVSPLLGALWAWGGAPLPAPVEKFLDLLGAATIPCALISLGLFLAHKQQGPRQGVTLLVLIKLIGHPLLTWFLAFKVFHLPPLWANSALLLSALPTGTGPFMLAEYYKREASVVSSTILISTLGSLVTLSICLYLIGN